MRKNDLPDYILRGISLAIKTYGHVKGQPTLNERIRKALVYQEWAKSHPKRLLEVTA